ncbi:hypothetical protein [Clostridium rectalis]|uniref:hypothetical protein n=1 Tax=Clostridium rectalis TaxID=2040295 RepID=UPI000F63851D|nr:hypothetical protein [Clostridium rectalis]
MEKCILNNEKYYKGVIILGMLLSVLWVFLVDTKPFSDFNYYYKLAGNIANGKSWGSTYTSVGYCIILGAIFKIFGISLLNAKIFNLFLTLGNYILFYNILKRVNLKERDRKIIFTLFVLIPSNIFYNSILATEPLFTNILIYITFVYFSDMKCKYVYLGILVGLNTMIKPYFIIYFFVIFLLELLINKNILNSIKNSLLILLICAITISPFIYRNTKLMGQFTYVSNNGGIVLYINNNSQNKTGRWMAAKDVENSIVKTEEYKLANQTVKNKMLNKAAKEWIKSHPIQFIKLGFKRLFNVYFLADDVFYGFYGTQVSDNNKINVFIRVTIIKNIIFIPAIIFILIYSIVVLKHIWRGETHLLNKYTLYNVILFYMFTSVYFITEGQGRYSFPQIFTMIYCFCGFINFVVKKKSTKEYFIRDGVPFLKSEKIKR